MGDFAARGFIVLTAGCALLLSGCSVSTGVVLSSPGASRSTVDFTSFDNLKPNQNVRAAGVSQGATLTRTVSTGEVTAASVGTADTANTYLTLGYNNSTNLDSARVQTATSDISWSTSVGDTITDKGVTYELKSADGNTTMVLGDAKDSWVNWNYQTFGVWQKTTITGPTATMDIGAISAGSLSPVSGIPTSGTGIYVGQAAGVYVDASGNLYSTTANLSATATFASRSISFNTTGTTTTASSGTTASASNLNLSGTLSYGASSNQFSGNLSSSGATMSGTAVGNFYGPNAEEIGGTYQLKASSGVETMIGGFGAKR